MSIDHNYAALILAILKGYSPEQAFVAMEKGVGRYRHELSKKDTYDMVEFRKQGLTYKQIGELYNKSAAAISKRVHRVTLD